MIARSLCSTPALQSGRFLGSSCPVARCCFLCTCSLNQQSSSFLFSSHHHHLSQPSPNEPARPPFACHHQARRCLHLCASFACVFFFLSVTSASLDSSGRSDVVLSFLARRPLFSPLVCRVAHGSFRPTTTILSSLSAASQFIVITSDIWRRARETTLIQGPHHGAVADQVFGAGAARQLRR